MTFNFHYSLTCFSLLREVQRNHNLYLHGALCLPFVLDCAKDVYFCNKLMSRNIACVEYKFLENAFLERCFTFILS